MTVIGQSVGRWRAGRAAPRRSVAECSRPPTRRLHAADVGRAGPADLILDDLHQLGRVRNPTRLQLRPHGNVVELNLERARRYQVGLKEVGHEEEHHAAVDFVLHQPVPPLRRGLIEELERVPPGHHQHNEQQLDDTNYFGKSRLPCRRGEVFSLHLQVGELVLDEAGILLKCLLVPS